MRKTGIISTHLPLIIEKLNIQYRTRNARYPSLTAKTTAISESITLAIIGRYQNYSAIMHNTGIVLLCISASVDCSCKAVVFLLDLQLDESNDNGYTVYIALGDSNHD